mgnify:CR=1 FL=1
MRRSPTASRRAILQRIPYKLVLGVGVEAARPALSVYCDNRAESRLELTRDGQTAILVYERTAKSFVLVHTEVPPALRGHRLGEALVKAGVEAARAEG